MGPLTRNTSDTKHDQITIIIYLFSKANNKNICIEVYYQTPAIEVRTWG